MAGALPHYKLGPASYVAGKPILGGTLVRAAGTSETGLSASAPSNATVVPNDSTTTPGTLLGVAVSDAGVGQYPEGAVVSSGAWSGNVVAGGTGGLGGTDTNLDVSGLGYTVAVANNVDIKVRYETTAKFGDRLWPSANGGVTNTVGTGPAIGYCSQPGGVTGSPSASAPVSARAFIRV